MKLLTVVMPCYNSAQYMRASVETLLPGGEEMDIIIIDDGSKDETGAIADEYAAKHPDIVRVVHQENGGHGEGINQGLLRAQGLYFKVVDSDDRLDAESLKRLLSAIRGHADDADKIDLIVSDYVYDQTDRPAVFKVDYKSVLQPGRVLTWEQTKRFPFHKLFMIHCLTYRTALLRESGMILPKHVFYEDNIYIYQPLPLCARVFYLDAPLYGYFIGRADQSINEKVILGRLDQHTLVAEKVACGYTLAQLNELPLNLRCYMLNFCAIMLATTCALQFIANTEESMALNRRMWQTIRAFDPALYRAIRRTPLGRAASLPGKLGRRALVFGYRAIRRAVHF